MNNSQCVAANLSAHERKGLAFLALTQIAQVTQLAEQQGISRQFIYRQKHMAEQAIDQAFAPDKTEVLFHLPVTPAWLDQMMLSLTLICKRLYAAVCKNLCATCLTYPSVSVRFTVTSRVPLRRRV